LFSRFGELSDARVVLRPNTTQCRGFGYVTFASGEQAALARAELDGLELDGGTIRVELAR
jgi:RNA recognition motif-containing protein